MIVRIRPATAADHPTLQAIEVEAGALFRDVGLPEIAEHEPFSLEELAAIPQLFVATDESGQEIVGYAALELVDGQSHLEQLSVRPSVGRHGVGTALLEHVADWARARGDTGVTLTTFRDVPFNGPLYAKRGFVEVPETEWSDALRARVAEEAEMGLDPAHRLVMRRPVGGRA